MTNITILPLSRLPNVTQRQAAQLYWAAFEGKLGRLLGPKPVALRLIENVLDPEHGLAALAPSGELVGVAGFRSDGGTFVPFAPWALRLVYGRFGAAWRLAAFYAISEAPDTKRFLIEGLAVAPDWQGQGIGTQLIDALATQARHMGYSELRLDVAAQNHGARQLYERLGFTTYEIHRYWLMAPVFGMRASHVMVRPA